MDLLKDIYYTDLCKYGTKNKGAKVVAFVLFTFLMTYFEIEKFIILMNSNLSSFFFNHLWLQVSYI